MKFQINLSPFPFSLFPSLISLHPCFVLIIAAVLDYLIGDPWSLPHPVQVMGWVISRFTQFVFKHFNSPIILRTAGIFLAVVLIIGSGIAGWVIVHTASLLHPIFGLAVESILLASCFAGRSLKAAAEDVLQHLKAGDIAFSRSTLSLYVGRDTQQLSKSEILRAVLETVTENATDGVMAPLFYAIAGAFIPFIRPVPLALAYKAASTLDSMVGYRLSGKPQYVLLICRRDGIKDPSPNSGWSQCAYAAVLGVQLGGINWYRGVAKHKPLLGDAINPITPEKIDRALQLTRYCFLIWLGLASMIMAIALP